MNQMLISGNATKDAELRMTNNAVPVVVINIADNATLPNGKTTTTYRVINVWGKDLCDRVQNIKKGDFVVAQGKMSDPTGKIGEDGRIFVNYRVDVSDTNLYSFCNFRKKVETVVNATE